MIDINELRRLAQAASPGPWWVNQDGLNHGFERGVAEINSKEWHALAGAWTINGAKHSEEGAANAEFIAAANPATVSELLDRLEAAEKERDNARELADRLALALNTSNHERDNMRAALEKIADWYGAYGPFPEKNEMWRAMAVVTAREAVPQKENDDVATD